MCFFITKDCVLKKATMNTPFYKWNNCAIDQKDETLFTSPSMNYIYYTGVIQPIVEFTLLPSDENDSPATHFDFLYLEEVLSGWDRRGEKYPCIRRGYHGCFKSSLLKHKSNSDYVYKFVIPKGAKYWHNEVTGFIVASTCYYTGKKIRVINLINKS